MSRDKRKKAVEYLEQLENMLTRMDIDKDYKETDILAVTRCCYWLLNEYLRLEERYDEALNKLGEDNGH